MVRLRNSGPIWPMFTVSCEDNIGIDTLASNRCGSQIETKKRVKQKSQEITDRCRECGEKVTYSQNGIVCEICRIWFLVRSDELEDEE